MNYSYDYSEFLVEFKEELEEGIITLDSSIQILRAAQSIEGYYPIVDWYYDDEAVMNDLKLDLLDSKKETKEKMDLKRRYEKDKPFLERITVLNCLNEMCECDRLFKTIQYN